MSKTIKVIRLGTPEHTRKSIKFILDQLEKQNYAHSYSSEATRLFSYFLNDYKKKGIIIISRCDFFPSPSNIRLPKNVISIDSNYKIIRNDDYSFKIEPKNKF